MKKTAKMTMNPGKVRDSSLEMLRIISMVLIIMHHYALHGGFNLNALPFGANKAFIEFLMVGGKLGVNCFIMITGYFMINSKFTIKKLINLICKVTIYSFVIQILFIAFHVTPFSYSSLFESIFPIFFGKYWFANAYVLLFLLSPFINKLIHSMDRKMHFRLICILSAIWCIIPSLPVYAVFASNLGWSKFDWTNLGWFILIYFISSYIRLYPMNYTNKCKLNFCMTGSFYGMLILLTALFYSLGGKFQKQAPNIMGMNNLLPLLCSITLFLAFKNLKMKPRKWINAVAATMFGVYLIHDNRLIRPFLWKTLFKNADYAESSSLFLHALIVVVSVLIVCILIDFIISRLIEKPLCTLVEKALNFVSPYIKKLFCFVRRCFDRTLNRPEKTGYTDSIPDDPDKY